MGKKTRKQGGDASHWIKHCFFYLLPFLLLQTDKLWRREHRVIQTSQRYCRSTNKSLTTTNNRGAAKEEARRTAFGNH